MFVIVNTSDKRVVSHNFKHENEAIEEAKRRNLSLTVFGYKLDVISVKQAKACKYTGFRSK